MKMYSWNHDKLPGTRAGDAERSSAGTALRPAAAVAIALFLTTSLVACKDKEESAPDKPKPAAKSPPAEPVAPVKLAPDFSAWDPAGKAKAWTGSWVVMDNGSFQAWTVDASGKIEVREDDQDKSFQLEVEIPCYAYFATDSGMKYPHPFTVLADGKLRTNAGGGGYRKGSEAIFCDASGTIYVLAGDGTCSAWKDDFEWKKEAAECSLAKNAEGKDVFVHAGPNEGEYLIEGDAILGGTKPTESATDHEAAKAAAAAKNAAR